VADRRGEMVGEARSAPRAWLPGSRSTDRIKRATPSWDDGIMAASRARPVAHLPRTASPYGDTQLLAAGA